MEAVPSLATTQLLYRWKSNLGLINGDIFHLIDQLITLSVIPLRGLDCIQSNLCTTTTPVTWKKWKMGPIKVRFKVVVDESNWSLLTGSRCSEEVVKAGLTVFNLVLSIIIIILWRKFISTRLVQLQKMWEEERKKTKKFLAE